MDSTLCEAATLACDSGTLLPLHLQGDGDSTAHVNCQHASSDVNASGSFSGLPTVGTSTLTSTTTTLKPPRRPRLAGLPVSSLATDLSHGFVNFHGRGQTCKEKTIAVL